MEIVRFSVLICLLFLCSCHAGLFTWKVRTMEEIPNPMANPAECGRPGVAASAICDPDNLLSKQNKDDIESKINALHSTAELAVVIIDQMKSESSWSFFRSIDSMTEKFARGLHDKWGVGDKNTNNGVLIFLSIRDRSMFISVGEGVADRLTDSVLDYIIGSSKSTLKKAQYGSAILYMISEIEFTLLHPEEFHNTKFFHYVLEYGYFLIIGIVLFFYMGSGCLHCYYGRQHSIYQKGNKALEKLLKEMATVEDGGLAENKYATTSCPICLEDFDHVLTSAESSAEERLEEGKEAEQERKIANVKGTKKSIKGLSCGHVFCEECITSYLQFNHRSNHAATCPICRQPVTPIDSTSSHNHTSSTQSNASYLQSFLNCCYFYRYFQLLELQQYPTPLDSIRTPYSNEFRFRLYRVHQLYPSVLDRNSLSRLMSDIQRGDWGHCNSRLALQVKENEQTMTSMKATQAKYNLSSGSSSRSFGGGRSFGGRGGRW
jgi:uncharacterized membrane protein YgcG